MHITSGLAELYKKTGLPVVAHNRCSGIFTQINLNKENVALRSFAKAEIVAEIKPLLANII